MNNNSLPRERSQQDAPIADRIASLCGLAAGWVAAGGAGLLGHPLRHALMWLAFGGMAIAIGPHLRRNYLPLTVAGLAVALGLTSSNDVTINLAAAVIAMLAFLMASPRCVATAMGAEAIAVLALFCFARTSIPFLWQAADATGTLAGRLVGALTGNPLWIGTGFAGIHFVVVTAYLAVMAPFRFAVPPTQQRKILVQGLLAVGVGYALYLAVLSLSAAIRQPSHGLEAATELAVTAEQASTAWGSIMQAVIPWNLPAVGMLIHIAVAGTIFRIAQGHPIATPEATSGTESTTGAESTGAGREPFRHRLRWAIGGGLLVLALAMAVAPGRRPPDLKGKRIVLYEKGFLNWLKPAHGQYGRFSIGMYGMLPTFLQSLGAETTLTSDLSEQGLRDADVLVVIYPNEPWEPGQVDAIWNFVREGGSLLVMGEHTVADEDGMSRFNELLTPSAIRVRFDSATFAVGGWLQSYEAMWHPITAGISDVENEFGIVIGASVQARLPARPLIIGRWGWADPGDVSSAAAMMGNGNYDPGERLGDVVLAAEQSIGNGKVIVFGDTSSLSNGINVGGHPFTSRLFAYLADHNSSPLPAWRQALGVLAVAALGVLLTSSAEPLLLSLVIASLAFCVSVFTHQTHAAWNVVPDGRAIPQMKLAYIDGCHLGEFSGESWREDGLAGLTLTLMRNQYQTLMLPELSSERLSGAQLLVSVAPSRPYTPYERAAIRKFVEQGGVFLCTVGNERSGPAETLLTELGFRVGTLHWQGTRREGITEPLGHFKTPYFNNGEQLAYVRFHAAWPIECTDPNAQVIARYPPDKPLIISRRLGRGRVVVIGDTCFAQNKNLEREDGEPFEGMRENADFWRWFLAQLNEDEPWYPLPLIPQRPASDSSALNAENSDSEAEEPVP